MRRKTDHGRDPTIYLPLAAMLMSVFVYVGVFVADQVAGKIASVVAILGIGLAFSVAILRQRRGKSTGR